MTIIESNKLNFACLMADIYVFKMKYTVMQIIGVATKKSISSDLAENYKIVYMQLKPENLMAFFVFR